MLDLSNHLNWVSLAEGMGVVAASLKHQGPCLIEALV